MKLSLITLTLLMSLFSACSSPPEEIKEENPPVAAEPQEVICQGKPSNCEYENSEYLQQLRDTRETHSQFFLNHSDLQGPLPLPRTKLKKTITLFIRHAAEAGLQ